MLAKDGLGGRVSFASSGDTLVIGLVEAGDAGAYHCSADNVDRTAPAAGGYVTGNHAFVTIQGKSFVEDSSTSRTLKYHIVSHCTTWYHMVPHGTTLYHIEIPHCTTLYHIEIPHCTTLKYHIVPHCTTLYHIVPHCTTLYHIVPHCTTLYHIVPEQSFDKPEHFVKSKHTASLNEIQSRHSYGHLAAFPSPVFAGLGLRNARRLLE